MRDDSTASALGAESSERVSRLNERSHRISTPDRRRRLFDPTLHSIRFASTTTNAAQPAALSDSPSHHVAQISTKKPSPNDVFSALEELDLEEHSAAAHTSDPDSHSTSEASAAAPTPNTIADGAPVQPDLPYNFTLPDPLPTYWTFSLYRCNGSPPPLYLASSFETAEKIAQLFVSETVVGMDLEWVPDYIQIAGRTPKHNVSLLQLASPTRIALFHIARFSGSAAADLIPPTLRHILETTSIVKAGVNIVGDANRLRTHMHVEMRGRFELSHLHSLVVNFPDNAHLINRRHIALADQVRHHFLLPLAKGSERISNWSTALTWEQQVYAANDVYASVMLYWHMERLRRGMARAPPRPEFDELKASIRLGDEELEERVRMRKASEAKSRTKTKEEKWAAPAQIQRVDSLRLRQIAYTSARWHLGEVEKGRSGEAGLATADDGDGGDDAEQHVHDTDEAPACEQRASAAEASAPAAPGNSEST